MLLYITEIWKIEESTKFVSKKKAISLLIRALKYSIEGFILTLMLDL